MAHLWLRSKNHPHPNPAQPSGEGLRNGALPPHARQPRKGQTVRMWYVLVVIVGWVMGTPLASAAPPHQDSNAPYLMAFGTTPTPHFVIERADGTDSRIFGEGLMPDDTNFVSGPGWSPSGDWFAWSANSQYLENNRGSTAYILSTDGQTRPTGLDDMARITVRWSPNADVLLVAGLLNPPIITYDPEYHVINPADSLTLRIGLFDPAANQFLQVHDMPAPFERDHLLEVYFRVQWRNDGQFGFVQTNEVGEDGTATTRFYAMGVNGEYSFRDYDRATLFTEDITPYYTDVMLTPRGEVVRHPQEDTLDFEDVVTGQPAFHYQILHENFEHLQWAPDGEHVLVTTTKACEEADCPKHALWFFDRPANKGTLLIWAQSESFVLYPAADYSRLIYVETRADGRYATYLQVADSKPVDLGKVMDIQEYYEDDPVVRWTNATRFVLATAHGDGGMNTFTAYKVTDGAPVQMGEFTAQTYGAIPPLAPNSPTALVNFDTLALMDVSSGTSVILPPDPRRYFTNPYGDGTWHPTQDWALVEENAAVAGGGAPIYSDVVNADGTVRRPLGDCIGATSICDFWLPPQVDPATLAPGHANTPIAPMAQIAVGGWTDELIWSPDGSQIAAGAEWRSQQGTVPFEVWRVADGEKIAHFEEVTWKQTITWAGDQPSVIDRTPSNALAASPDGSRLVYLEVEDSPYTVHLDITDANFQLILRVDNVIADWHPSASYSPDGRYLAVSSAQNPVRILDAQTGEILGELPLIHSNAVAFSPDGTQLAVAYSTEIHIYQVADVLAR